MSLLRARRDEFEEAGVGIFAISRDSPYSHVAWREVLELNFPLLSDWHGETVAGFDVEQEFGGMRGVAERSAFLVDEGGRVRGAWLYETGEVPDMDELLAAVRALRPGGGGAGGSA